MENKIGIIKLVNENNFIDVSFNINNEDTLIIPFFLFQDKYNRDVYRHNSIEYNEDEFKFFLIEISLILFNEKRGLNKIILDGLTLFYSDKTEFNYQFYLDLIEIHKRFYK